MFTASVLSVEQVSSSLDPRHSQIRRERVSVAHHVVEADLTRKSRSPGAASRTYVKVVLDVEPLVIGEQGAELALGVTGNGFVAAELVVNSRFKIVVRSPSALPRCPGRSIPLRVPG